MNNNTMHTLKIHYLLIDDNGALSLDLPILLKPETEFYTENGLFKVSEQTLNAKGEVQVTANCEKTSNQLSKENAYNPFAVLNGYKGVGLVYLLEERKALIDVLSIPILLSISTEFDFQSDTYKVTAYTTSKGKGKGFEEWKPENGIGELTLIAERINKQL